MQLKPLTVAVITLKVKTITIFRDAYCVRRLKIATSSDIYTVRKTREHNIAS